MCNVQKAFRINDNPPLNIQNNVYNCQSMMHKTGIRIDWLNDWK